MAQLSARYAKDEATQLGDPIGQAYFRALLGATIAHTSKRSIGTSATAASQSNLLATLRGGRFSSGPLFVSWRIVQCRFIIVGL